MYSSISVDRPSTISKRCMYFFGINVVVIFWYWPVSASKTLSSMRIVLISFGSLCVFRLVWLLV